VWLGNDYWFGIVCLAVIAGIFIVCGGAVIIILVLCVVGQ